MFKGITKIFGSELALDIFELVIKTYGRSLEITSVIYKHHDTYCLQVCVGDFCKEVEVSKETARLITERLQIRLHQVNGLYFKVRKIQREKYYLTFRSQLSW